MPERPGQRKRLYGFTPVTHGERMQNRPQSSKQYQTYRWKKESKLFKEANPLCVICFVKGIIRKSEVTDHIIPAEIYPDFFDKNNWQALCTSCNIVKGNQDKTKINEYRKNNKRAH